MDLLHALQHHLRELACDLDGGGRFRCRIFFHHHRHELHDHDAPDARAGPDLVSFAVVCLVTLCHQLDSRPRHTGARDHTRAHVGGTFLGCRNFRSETGWRSRPVPASLLVLFAPGCLHHDFARHGRDQRTDYVFFAQTNFRIWLCRSSQHGDRDSGIRGLGPSHVC